MAALATAMVAKALALRGEALRTEAMHATGGAEATRSAEALELHRPRGTRCVTLLRLPAMWLPAVWLAAVRLASVLHLRRRCRGGAVAGRATANRAAWPVTAQTVAILGRGSG